MKPPNGALLLLFAYGAGLVTGLSHFLDPSLGATTLVLAAFILRQHWWCVLPLAVLAGGAHGHVVQARRSNDCAYQLPLGEARFTLTLVDPGAGSGRVTMPDCRGATTARWPRTSTLRAGESAEVVARWIPRQGMLGFVSGQLIVRTVERQWGIPGPVAQFRNRVKDSTGRLYGQAAPLVEALVVGWRGELDPGIRQAFAASGLVHLLAISGFHIGLLAGWVLLVLRLLRVPRHTAEATAAAAAIAYALFLGWPPPAARASLLAALLAFARWRQRKVLPSALLAASAAIVLVSNPSAIVGVGAWLSVLALAGLTATTRWSDRVIGRTAMIRAVSGSIGAMIATAPVTAFVFGQVAPVGVLLNVVAVPIAVLLVPALLASLLLDGILPSLSAAFAASGGLLLELLQRVAELGSRMPGAAVAGSGGAALAAPWVAVALVGIWAIHGRTTAAEAGRRLGWGGTLALLALLLVRPAAAIPLGAGGLALVFADVGQGDGTLIRTPGGHWVVVDAGPADARWDAGERVMLPLLRRHGATRVEAIVISHAHRDHVGGAAAITAALPVGIAMEPGEPFVEPSYHRWLEELAQRAVRWRAVRGGTSWELDGVRFTVVHPPPVWPNAGEDLNEDSVVLEIRWGQFRALLMGDAGTVTERALAGLVGNVDLLKVGHHGSRTASSAAFLAELTPTVAVLSSGRNGYGHPTLEALARLAQVGARIWRTDREGTITVETDGQTFTVRGASGSTTYTAVH